MKYALCILAGFIFCVILWPREVRIQRGVVHSENEIIDEAYLPVSDVSITGDTTAERVHGSFSPDIIYMLHEVLTGSPNDSDYVEPDSSNTRLFWLSRWTSETVLVETSAGSGSYGSCGAGIHVFQHDEVSETWNSIFYTCGQVDTVFHVSHSGMCGFAIAHSHAYPTEHFRYNGKEFVQFKDPAPLNEFEIVRNLIGKHDNIAYPQTIELHAEYVMLDSATSPYIFAWYDMSGTFLLKETEPGKIEIVNFLEGVVEVDVSEKFHNGMPDIKTFNTGYFWGYYRWNGNHYVLHHKEPWQCPA